MDRKLAAIAIPISNRNYLTKDENLSFRQLGKHLGPYDRYLVLPEYLEIVLPGTIERRFSAKYFGSAEAHRKLLFSTEFYESFKDYQFVLIYHLDALVFSDQLEAWCKSGFDYIAPPWIKHADAPYAGNPEYEGKVGNGGFSLRKVDSFLKVINSKKLSRGPVESIRSAIRYGKSVRKYSAILKFFHYCRPKYNGVRNEMDAYFQNEDHFWANRAEHYYPAFKVAPVGIALKFAFECVPRYCFELTGGTLPFGCHAWQKYDPGFWEPFIR
jgi:hypothetical protein